MITVFVTTRADLRKAFQAWLAEQQRQHYLKDGRRQRLRVASMRLGRPPKKAA